jgi:serine protease Do
MKGLIVAALTAAFVLGAGLPRASSARAQMRESLFSAIDVARGARLGVTVKDAEDAKAGVVVESVTTGGPAEKAGIKAGDTLVEFDGEKVRSATQFSRLVRETPSGRTVAVALMRGGQRQTMNVTTEAGTFGDDFGFRYLDGPRMIAPATPAPPAPPRAARPPAIVTPEPALPLFRRLTGGRLGITIETLDDQLAAYFGVKDGTLVKSVAEGSAAQKAGVKAGDVITAVNGRHVYDTSDVNRAIDRIEDSGEFTLEVMRDKKALTLKGKIEREAATTRIRTIL